MSRNRRRFSRSTALMSRLGALLLGTCATFTAACAPPDHDRDGYLDADKGGDDCDDGDPAIHPNANDEPYDGIDQDCSGQDRADLDHDGYVAVVGGGDDCDDADDAIHPGVPDIPYDGIDQDCSGFDLTDVDGDGYPAIVAGGTDCDDTNPEASPGQPSTAMALTTTVMA